MGAVAQMISMIRKLFTMKLIAMCAHSAWARGLNRLERRAKRRVLATSVFASALLAACAGPQGAGGPEYRCEHGIAFSARFVDNSAVLTGTGGHDVLYRDAGGQGERQSVYSNPRMRAEFGMGASGKEAILRYPLLPLVARCVRD